MESQNPTSELMWREHKPAIEGVPLWRCTPWPPDLSGPVIIVPSKFPQLLDEQPELEGDVTMQYFTKPIGFREILRKPLPPFTDLLRRQRSVRFPLGYSMPINDLLSLTNETQLTYVKHPSALKALGDYNGVSRDAVKAPDTKHYELTGYPERNINYLIAYALAANPDVRAQFPTSAQLEEFLTANNEVFYPDLLKTGFENLITRNSIAKLKASEGIPPNGIHEFYQEVSTWLTELALSELSHTNHLTRLNTDFPLGRINNSEDMPSIDFAPYLLMMTALFVEYLPDNIPRGRSFSLRNVYDGVDHARRTIHRMAGFELLRAKGEMKKDLFALPETREQVQTLIDIMGPSGITAGVGKLYRQLKDIDRYLNMLLNYYEQNQHLINPREDDRRPDSRSSAHGPSFADYRDEVLRYTGATNLYTLDRRFRTMVGTRQ